MRDINLLLGCITSSAVGWLKVMVPRDVKPESWSLSWACFNKDKTKDM